MHDSLSMPAGGSVIIWQRVTMLGIRQCHTIKLCKSSQILRNRIMSILEIWIEGMMKTYVLLAFLLLSAFILGGCVGTAAMIMEKKQAEELPVVSYNCK